MSRGQCSESIHFIFGRNGHKAQIYLDRVDMQKLEIDLACSFGVGWLRPNHAFSFWIKNKKRVLEGFEKERQRKKGRPTGRVADPMAFQSLQSWYRCWQMKTVWAKTLRLCWRQPPRRVVSGRGWGGTRGNFSVLLLQMYLERYCQILIVVYCLMLLWKTWEEWETKSVCLLAILFTCDLITVSFINGLSKGSLRCGAATTGNGVKNSWLSIYTLQ